MRQLIYIRYRLFWKPYLKVVWINLVDKIKIVPDNTLWISLSVLRGIARGGHGCMSPVTVGHFLSRPRWPQTSIGALPLDPTGNFRPLDSLVCPLSKFLATFRFVLHLSLQSPPLIEYLKRHVVLFWNRHWMTPTGLMVLCTVAVLWAGSEDAVVHRLWLRSLFEARPDRTGRHSAELGGSRSSGRGMESACQRCQWREGKKWDLLLEPVLSCQLITVTSKHCYFMRAFEFCDLNVICCGFYCCCIRWLELDWIGSRPKALRNPSIRNWTSLDGVDCFCV